MTKKSKTVNGERPLLYLPKLAALLGDKESLFIQQLHYWLERSKHTKNGRKWVYNTYEDWQQQFPGWCVLTIKRLVKKLEKKGLILSANYNRSPADRTKWYSIDYEVLRQVSKEAGVDIEQFDTLQDNKKTQEGHESYDDSNKMLPSNHKNNNIEGPPVLSTSSLSKDKESIDKTSPPKIFSSENSLRKKVPKQSEEALEAEVQTLIESYPPPLQSLLETCLDEFKTTRMTGTISLGKIRKFLLDIQKYPEDCIRAGFQRYIDMDCAGDGKNERYALGIIRGISKQNNHNGFESDPAPTKQPRKLLKDMIPVDLRRNLKEIHPREDWDYPIFVARIKKGKASYWEYDYVYQKDHLWFGKSFLDEFKSYEEVIEHYKEVYQKMLPEIERRESEMFKTYEELHPEEFMREDDDVDDNDLDDDEELD